MSILTTNNATLIPTIDASNNSLINPAAEGRKTVNPDNHVVEPSSNNSAEQTVPSTTPAADAAAPVTPPTPANPEVEARKLFLAASKEKRESEKLKKESAAGLKKAQAIEAAIEATKSGKDPTALLKAAGVDPIKFYQDLTTYALKAPEKAEDPVQKELREHRERLDSYAAEKAKLEKELQTRDETAQHNAVISAQVVPLLQNNPDRYEALLTEYGANAAFEVYNALYQRYQQLGHFNDDAGVPLTFERVADSLEKYWSDQIESGLNVALKMKKFQSRFGQNSETSRKNQERQSDTPNNRPFTLTNNHNLSVTPGAKAPPYLDWDQRVAQAKKQAGIT